MNKRGDISTIMLFFVTLFLVIYAVFSFVSFRGSFESNDEEINILLEGLNFNENYLIESIKLVAKRVIVNNKDKEGFKNEFLRIGKEYGFEGLEDFYEKIRTGDFIFEKRGEVYFFEMKGVKLRAKNKFNELIREISLLMEFDVRGNLIE